MAKCNAVLFVKSKFRNLGTEKLRSIVYDFYNGEQVSVANKTVAG